MGVPSYDLCTATSYVIPSRSKGAVELGLVVSDACALGPIDAPEMIQALRAEYPNIRIRIKRYIDII